MLEQELAEFFAEHDWRPYTESLYGRILRRFFSQVSDVENLSAAGFRKWLMDQTTFWPGPGCDKCHVDPRGFPSMVNLDQFGQGCQACREQGGWAVPYLVTRRADYAVRLLLGLARHPQGSRLPARQISREMLIPLPMLYALLKPLAQAGLIRTYPGSQGGIALARPLHEISLWDIVTTVERAPVVSPCVEDFDFCPLAPGCPVRKQWLRLQHAIEHHLRSVTLADLQQDAAGERSWPLHLPVQQRFPQNPIPEQREP